MKAIITVKEFTEKYLDDTQIVHVIDFDSDYPYFYGQASEIKLNWDVIYSARVKKVSNYHSLLTKDGIVLYI